jgi:hypothetical protein
MLNPWLTLPFQAVRLGWETQSIVADQMMRLAGLGISDRKVAGNSIADITPLPIADALEAPTSSVAVAPAKSGKSHQAAQKIREIQKKRSLGSKRRRSK